MAYDWYIVEPASYQEFLSHRRRWFRHEYPELGTGTHIAMSENAHQDLMSRCGYLPLLQRAADYYRDAAYAPAEVAKLLDELTVADGLAGAIELAALCQEALQWQCAVIALAD